MNTTTLSLSLSLSRFYLCSDQIMPIEFTSFLNSAYSASLYILFYQVAEAFGHILDLRLEWLQSLADHHLKCHNLAEAGQCYLTMAELCKGHLDELSGKDDEKTVVKYYEECVRCLAEAELYEQCHTVYKDLVLLYEKQRDYVALSRCYNSLHEVFERLVLAEKTQSRMLGMYLYLYIYVYVYIS